MAQAPALPGHQSHSAGHTHSPGLAHLAAGHQALSPLSLACLQGSRAVAGSWIRWSQGAPRWGSCRPQRSELPTVPPTGAGLAHQAIGTRMLSAVHLLGTMPLGGLHTGACVDVVSVLFGLPTTSPCPRHLTHSGMNHRGAESQGPEQPLCLPRGAQRHHQAATLRTQTCPWGDWPHQGSEQTCPADAPAPQHLRRPPPP